MRIEAVRLFDKLDDVLRKHKSFKSALEYHICIRTPLSFVEKAKTLVDGEQE